MSLKRYLVFRYEAYYPDGGWNDFEGDFSSLGEAKEHGAKIAKKYDGAHIVDCKKGGMILFWRVLWQWNPKKKRHVIVHDDWYPAAEVVNVQP